MNEIKIFCPATIANLNCGFDVLGLCLDGIGDEMIVRKVSQKGIKITKIVGADLPFETEKNVAGVAALAILGALKKDGNKYVSYESNNVNYIEIDCGFEIEIYKNLKLGSGIGSSSASAAGAVFGINELLGKPFSRSQLVEFAMKGEVVASGSEHADNVAPCLLGGFTLVCGYKPLHVEQIISPADLFAVVLHPHIEVKTSDARAVLQPMISLKNAITQTGNLGGFIAGLYTNNYELMARSMQDVIIEPMRKHLIPNFDLVKNSALENGALGAGISGAGPSIFALCKGKTSAEKVALAMTNSFNTTTILFDVHISNINKIGTRILRD